MLASSMAGFGLLAFAGVAAGGSFHHRPRARAVIHLFMEGGPSQVDTFDYKPELGRRHGQNLPFQKPATTFNSSDKIMVSPFEFRRHGQSGAWVSSMFPHLARQVDDLTIIKSLHHNISTHSQACYMTHSGSFVAGRPSMGSWVSYGLGHETDSLPGFVVLDCGQAPSGGPATWGSGFLPNQHAGVKFLKGPVTVEYLSRQEKTAQQQRIKLDTLRELNASEALLGSYETAARMQLAVPDLMDLSGETKATRNLYGMDRKECDLFGSRCLLARRLVERGVRFIEVFSPRVKGDRWDQHGQLKEGHVNNAVAVDQPIAGLLADLKARGLLNNTIVMWSGEFGRTPTSQGGDGRDHSPWGYTTWLAGGGFQPGLEYGATDEFGYFAERDKVHLHDLHATMLHALGLDHERLTFRFDGRDHRLTDVYGNVVPDLMA